MQIGDFAPWGPNGLDVYYRTYSRTKPDGSREQWSDTVDRVVDGNMRLVYKDGYLGNPELESEFLELTSLMLRFAVLPAGRHLWASGVKGRQFLFNCWVAPWSDRVSEHFEFTFLRLMEGGGVGATYSTEKLKKYGPVRRPVEVHIVCDPDHPDHSTLREEGLLSSYYSPDYQGSYYEVEDSREGWAGALVDLLEAAWDPNAHPVRVYDVSRVRPAGSRLKTFGGHASGPAPLARMLMEVGQVLDELAPQDPTMDMPEGRDGLHLDPISAMEIDHSIAACVVAGGNRRSARMSIMPWDDPHIFEFIRLKADTGSHWSTNISVQVDDLFWDEVHEPDSLAHQVLMDVSEGMLLNGEPGIWNKTLSNVGEVNEVTSTNPCGEIALPEWGACVLGHINLEAFAPKKRGEPFDLYGAMQAARLMTRFLIRATYGDINDPRAREVMDRDRRIGVGLFGFQAALAKMGIRYSDAPKNGLVVSILNQLRTVILAEAERYAFELRIPVPIKVTTVAPTGTIAKLPGTTEGIHPIFARHFIRRIRYSTLDPEQVKRIEEYKEKGYHVEPCMYAANTMVVELPTRDRLVEEVTAMGYDPSIVESADELTLGQMLEVQAMVQSHYADNAVSFTANIDPTKYTPEDIFNELRRYGPSLKGSTIFPDQSRPQAPYERISEEEFELYEATQVGEGVNEECASGACSVR